VRLDDVVHSVHSRRLLQHARHLERHRGLRLGRGGWGRGGGARRAIEWASE
jgi:hypothetical protein